MDMMNDISFEVGGKLVVLIEHQSTINENMPLRLLMYIGRVYEKIVKAESIYKSKQVAIPRPEFYVLYNGTTEYPEEKTLRLSEAFNEARELGKSGKASLELEVKVLNINEGKNREVVEKSRELEGYIRFVGKIREYHGAGHSKEEAFRLAITYCMTHDILKVYLEEHGSEVVNMLMTEWKMEDYGAVRYEEGREEGREEGLEETARKALAEGIPPELIQKITGLEIGKIMTLR